MPDNKIIKDSTRDISGIIKNTTNKINEIWKVSKKANRFSLLSLVAGILVGASGIYYSIKLSPKNPRIMESYNFVNGALNNARQELIYTKDNIGINLPFINEGLKKEFPYMVIEDPKAVKERATYLENIISKLQRDSTYIVGDVSYKDYREKETKSNHTLSYSLLAGLLTYFGGIILTGQWKRKALKKLESFV